MAFLCGRAGRLTAFFGGFRPEQYHLYEMIYDPYVFDSARCTSYGFPENFAAHLYVDGTDQDPYYPYRFPSETASTATLQWGSRSSDGQVHLRYSLVH